MKKMLLWSPLIFFVLSMTLAGYLINFAVNIDCESSESPECQEHIPSLQYFSVSDEDGVARYFTPFKELEARMVWCLSVLFFFMSFATGVALVVSVVSSLRVPKDVHYVGGVLFILLVAAAIELLPAGEKFDFNVPIFKVTDLLVSMSDSFVGAIEYSGVVMLVVLALACCAVLSAINLRLKSNDDESDRAKNLLIGRRYLQTLLNAGGIVLVAGVIHSSALYSWAMTSIKPATQDVAVVDMQQTPVETVQKPYYEKDADIPVSMGAINGIFYSLLIGAIFLPAFVVLKLEVDAVAKGVVGDDSPTKIKAWIQENNLTVGIPQKALSAVVALAPALVGGPALSLIEVLG